MNYDEWSKKKQWNPFNSAKLMAQIYRWRLIGEGNTLPQPSTVTVDPISVCNFKCKWCNAEELLRNKHHMMSEKLLMELAETLASWKGTEEFAVTGVESICLAGGGEPLLNPHVGKFIDKCVELGIEVGIVTNGSLLDRFIPELAKCTWVGVSIDAGTPELFKQQKRVDMFDKVIDNIKKLATYAREHHTKLEENGISYKYLLTPTNIKEIYIAAELAKEIGCKNFHMRPVGLPWSKDGTDFDKNLCIFKDEDIDLFHRLTEKARQLEDESFGVYGVTHKFDNQFRLKHDFKKCHAIFMNGVFMPGNNEDHLDFGLCCDRRYDDGLYLIENGKPEDVKAAWGSKKHWDMFKKLDVNTCPRCTFSPHNNIFENVILRDSMTYKFV